MGFNLIVQALAHYVKFESITEDSTFSIHNIDVLSQDEDGTIYFEEDNLDIFVKELQEKGIIFTKEREDKLCLWYEVHQFNPDKNKIIYKADKNRKNSP